MTRVFLAVTLATMLVGVLLMVLSLVTRWLTSLIAQRRRHRAQVAAAPSTPAPPQGILLTGSTGLQAALAHHLLGQAAFEERRRQLQERVEQFSARRRIRSPLSDALDRTAWAWQVTMPHADGVETVLRCTMHEDCRQDANIGIACARDRVDQGRPPGHGP